VRAVQEIGPSDSVSVAWMNSSERQDHPALDAEAIGLGYQASDTPVTIEAPDGSRHAMNADLLSVGSVTELRGGLLQAYQELLGLTIPVHSLRIHARLRTGASVLLTDDDQFGEAIRSAVSLYAWACLDRQQAQQVQLLSSHTNQSAAAPQSTGWRGAACRAVRGGDGRELGSRLP